MNWKLIVIGALVFYVTTFALGMVSGMVIHEGVLDSAYDATKEFWQPALTEDPPDMAALMPHWILTGLLFSLITAGIFDCIRGSFTGPGWKKGMVFGLTIAIFYCGILLQFTGVFHLPMKIWIWWGGEALVIWAIGGAALGATAAKISPES